MPVCGQRTPPRYLVAVAFSAVLALPLVLAATSASAALTPGTGWTSITLPAGYTLTDGPPLSPVSCVHGTQFCVVVAGDVNVTVDSVIRQGDLVTTDGHAWNHYEGLPVASIADVNAISCPTTSDCWVAGAGPSDEPEVAQSVDGGQTWTLMTPASWTGAGATWWPNGIDCVSTSTCWVVGMSSDSSYNPAVAQTTDGGATWTKFTNLPAGPPHGGPGSYILSGISCTSALACVAVGGYPFSNGVATVLTTTDGGATWSSSADPTLAGIQYLDSVSCVPGTVGLATCNAAGSALQATGPVEMTSTDGGATWAGVQTSNNAGWLNSISCADAKHCWAALTGSSVALTGTVDGGGSWSEQTSDTTNQDGSVSCASISFCVATTDKTIWTTFNDGGLASGVPARPLRGAAARQAAAAKPVTFPLPKVSGSVTWARSGRSATITGQYRGTVAAKTASVLIEPPAGSPIHARATIGLNGYYSITIRGLMTGTTTVTFTAGDAKKNVVRVHGHPGPAPTIAALSSHAGPAAGGTYLTIRGTNFTKVTKVLFGTRPGSGLKVRSATRLTVRVPAGTGARYLSVVTASGGPSALTGRSVYNFLPAPAVTVVSPASGPPAGGITVTITGTGLAFVKAVFFGAHRGTHLVVISARKIKIVAPAGSGTVDVRVTTAGGTSRRLAADRFTY